MTSAAAKLASLPEVKRLQKAQRDAAIELLRRWHKAYEARELVAGPASAATEEAACVLATKRARELSGLDAATKALLADAAPEVRP